MGIAIVTVSFATKLVGVRFSREVKLHFDVLEAGVASVAQKVCSMMLAAGGGDLGYGARSHLE